MYTGSEHEFYHIIKPNEEKIPFLRLRSLESICYKM